MSSSSSTGGHIKLARKMFDAEDLFWGDGTKFDSRSAWTDLIQLAAWKPYRYRGVDELQRGEFVASVRYLAERWKWSKSAVQRWISRAQKAGRIAGRRTGHHGIVYLIVNYDTYQTAPTERGTRSGTPRGTEVGQTWDKLEGSKAVKQLNPTVADAPVGESEPADSPPAPAPFRLAPYLDIHREIRGESVPPAQKWAKSFKALERKFGADEVQARWRRCLTAKGEFATPQWLGQNWSDYAEDAPAKGSGGKTALQELEELGEQDPWWTEGLRARRAQAA